MQYQGNDIYKIFLNDREIELSKDDIKSIIDDCFCELSRDEAVSAISKYMQQNKNNDDMQESNRKRVSSNHDEDETNKTQTRNYHKKEKIIKLFNQYFDNTKTKKEVFEQIAEKLNITVKAVEKAYYSK